MKIADREYIDAATGKIKKVGDLFNEISMLKQKLEKIKEYIYTNTDFDESDGIKSKTSGYDILEIINGD